MHRDIVSEKHKSNVRVKRAIRTVRDGLAQSNKKTLLSLSRKDLTTIEAEINQ